MIVFAVGGVSSPPSSPGKKRNERWLSFKIVASLLLLSSPPFTFFSRKVERRVAAVSRWEFNIVKSVCVLFFGFFYRPTLLAAVPLLT